AGALRRPRRLSLAELARAWGPGGTAPGRDRGPPGAGPPGPGPLPGSGPGLPAGFDLTSTYGAASTCGLKASGHVSVSGSRRPFFDHVRSPTPEPYRARGGGRRSLEFTAHTSDMRKA